MGLFQKIKEVGSKIVEKIKSKFRKPKMVVPPLDPKTIEKMQFRTKPPPSSTSTDSKPFKFVPGLVEIPKEARDKFMEKMRKGKK